MTTEIAVPNGWHDLVGESYGLFSDLNFNGVEIPVPQGTGKEGHGDTYSAFMHKQAELTNFLYSVVLQGDIDDAAEELLLLQLFRHFEREWTAEIANRKAYRGLAEERAGKLKARFGEEQIPDTDSGGNQLRDVDELVHDWHRATSLLTEALVQKRLHGLAHVRAALAQKAAPVLDEDGNFVMVKARDEAGRFRFDEDSQPVMVPKTAPLTCRERLKRAREEAERVRYEVAELPPNHNQYFWARIECLQIDIDNNFDVQLGIPVRDYTDVKAKLLSGIPFHQLIDQFPWAFQELYARVRVSLKGKDWRDYLTTNQIQQWPYDRRPPKGKNGIMDNMKDFFGGGEDDEDQPDTVEEDQRPNKRGKNRGKNNKNQQRNQGRRR